MVFLELAAIGALTLFNGVLALSELAILSARKGRLEYLAAQGSRGAKAALRLAGDPGRFLSTVQIGITLVGIVAGAFSGATLGARLGAWLEQYPAVSPYGHELGIGATVVAITYISLVFGELVPKRLAVARPERLAALMAPLMAALSVAGAPAVWVLQASTDRVLRVLGVSGKTESTITEDEVRAMIAEGTRTGVFAPLEQELIDGVLRLADRPIRVMMTPRSQVVWVDAKADWDGVRAIATRDRFSRLLVCDGTVDRPVGAVHTKDLLPLALDGSPVPLRAVMTPLLYIPDRTPVLKVLNAFKKERVHMAVVIDEYGSTEGLVTITDVLESIAGDFPELGDDEAPRIMQRDDGSWLVDGTLPIDEAAAAVNLTVSDQVNTVAGFVLRQLGRIPEAGASFRYQHVRFEVIDMDGRRVDKVLIELVPPRDCDAEEGR